MARALFVCLHNAGRSQMSAALFEQAAAGRHEAKSAGTTPGERVHPAVAEVMGEVGVDLSQRKPQKLTAELAQWADVVVTMGCGDECPYIPGKRYVDWDLPDPKGRPVDEVRKTRDDIAERVAELVRELDAADKRTSRQMLDTPRSTRSAAATTRSRRSGPEWNVMRSSDAANLFALLHRARPEDLDPVVELIGEFRDWWGKSSPSDGAIRETASRLLSDPNTEFFLARDADGRAVGVAQVRYRLSVWTGSDDCWLEDLFVTEAARSGGYGRRLVEAAVESARARGCKRIELDVNEQNEDALRFYSALGFTTEPKPPGRTLFVSRLL